MWRGAANPPLHSNPWVRGFSLSIADEPQTFNAGLCLLHDLLFLLTHGNFYRSHAGVSSKVVMSKIGHMGVPYWADVGMASAYKYRSRIQ
jgi:hypothetical protein